MSSRRPETEMTSFGRKVHRLCLRHGLSLRQVALIAGVCEHTVSRWIGGIGSPKTRNLQRIADAFRVPAQWLIDDGDETEPESVAPPVARQSRGGTPGQGRDGLYLVEILLPPGTVAGFKTEATLRQVTFSDLTRQAMEATFSATARAVAEVVDQTTNP